MKIRTVKEQYELRNICLRERLEQILPEVMRESEADLWLHASKEYHEDPTFRALTPADYPTARRVTMFAFVKDGDEVQCKATVCTAVKQDGGRAHERKARRNVEPHHGGKLFGKRHAL